MERIKKYSQVLGLKKPVNAAELKRLYRVRAKYLHPDVNSNLASHDQFVLLQEAYEFYKRSLDVINKGGEITSPFGRKKYPIRYSRETWKVGERQAARRRAADRARMRHERFKELGYFRLLDRLFFAFEIVRFILAILLLFYLPVFLYNQEGLNGLLTVFLVQVATYRLWSSALKRFILPQSRFRNSAQPDHA